MDHEARSCVDPARSPSPRTAPPSSRPSEALPLLPSLLSSRQTACPLKEDLAQTGPYRPHTKPCKVKIKIKIPGTFQQRCISPSHHEVTAEAGAQENRLEHDTVGRPPSSCEKQAAEVPTTQEHVDSIRESLYQYRTSQPTWGRFAKKVKRIPNVADRGITVNQLRMLSQFIIQLCKTGLLKHTTSRAGAEGLRGMRIRWHDINMYHITDEITEKLIQHTKPTMVPDASHAGEAVCSWVEFVSSCLQPAKIFFSHWWGGCFRDTMGIVTMLLRDKGISAEAALWICTFAVNQKGEVVGTKIRDTPFMKAIAQAELTVLLVDRSAGSLRRTWCALELHRTAEDNKDLEVYTPLGKVGDGRASSGPLIESLREFDIRSTETSDDSYRRQILNYIVREDEATGLKQENGVIQLLQGRPALEDERQDEGVRPSGRPRLMYESELFKKHAKEFEAVNMQVRMEVYATLGKHRRPKGCTVKELFHRAVSLGQWRALCREMTASYKYWKPSQESYNDYRNRMGKPLVAVPIQADHMSLYEVDAFFWGPKRRDAGGCSIMETLSSGPQAPQTYVNWYPGGDIAYMITAIDHYAEAMQLTDSWMFYFKMLAVCEEVRDTRDSNTYIQPIRLMSECDSILAIVDNDFSSLNRLWRLYEFELASRSSLGMYMSCNTGVLACNKPFPDGNWIFGNFGADIARHLQNVDVSTAHCCSSIKDTEVLSTFFGPSTVQRLQHRCSLWGAGPMLFDAVLRDDAAEVKKLFSLPGLAVNSSLLRDNHRRSFLHRACSSGSLDAAKQLLQLKADPNVEDDSRFTPLHYAAMVGNADAVSLLLEAKADIMQESCDALIPFEIACQNPAGFLGVCTKDVSKLLQPTSWNRRNVLSETCM